jgi:hypothetical protein
MSKFALIVSCNLRECSEQEDGLADEVIKVKSVVSLLLCFIGEEYFSDSLRLRVLGIDVGCEVFGSL